MNPSDDGTDGLGNMWAALPLEQLVVRLLQREIESADFRLRLIHRNQIQEDSC